jgi:hypothetical protein
MTIRAGKQIAFLALLQGFLIAISVDVSHLLDFSLVAQLWICRFAALLRKVGNSWTNRDFSRFL